MGFLLDEREIAEYRNNFEEYAYWCGFNYLRSEREQKIEDYNK